MFRRLRAPKVRASESVRTDKCESEVALRSQPITNNIQGSLDDRNPPSSSFPAVVRNFIPWIYVVRKLPTRNFCLFGVNQYRLGSLKQRRLYVYPLNFGLLVVVSIVILQIHAFVREYQGPLDHVTTDIWKPFYGMSCPDFSMAKGPLVRSDENYHGENKSISWDCNSIFGDSGNENDRKEDLRPKFPRIFMMGARGKEEDTFYSWKLLLHSNETSYKENGTHHNIMHPQLQRINTLRISNKYALSGGALRQTSNERIISTNTTSSGEFLCRKMTWEQRLFAVYQSIFHKLLTTYPNDLGFVLVEDDATLKNPSAFFVEVCLARHERLEFYSLYRSPLQWQGKKSPSCIYRHGTVAFYIQRSLMEMIVEERRRGLFCRFPIDMYISKLGPWYATRREVVGHLESGRVGSSREFTLSK